MEDLFQFYIGMAITAPESKSDFKITCEDFGENWLCYKDSTL